MAVRPLIALAAFSAVCSLASACAPSTTRLDLCGRGDRVALAAALEGGTFTLETLDDDGAVIDAVTVAAAGEEVSLALGGAARVRVTGYDVTGGRVAEGETPVDGGAACVCVAVAGQTAACAGLLCRVDGDACTFLDEETGEVAATRIVSLAPVDTTLVEAEPNVAHGDGERLAAAAGAQVGLLRFDTSVLPRTAVLEDATLILTALPPPTTPSGVPIAVVPVLEVWNEATATWAERAAGAMWLTPGCGSGSCGEPWAMFDPDRASERISVPLGRRPRAWIATPGENRGVALIARGGASTFWAREGDDALAAPPELVVAFHTADGPPIDVDQPICGNGIVEDNEACDDGDQDDLDACTTACVVARCGDGFVRVGVEGCDDGNQAEDDGCTSRCQRCDDVNAVARTVEAGVCYERYTRASSLTVAENSCNAGGFGVVASFDTLAQQGRVLGRLGLGATTEVYLGVSDRTTEGQYDDPGGTPTAYTAWAAGEPATPGDGLDCVTVKAGQWQSVGCGSAHGYVCERAGWRVDENDGRALGPVLGIRSTWEGARLACEEKGAHLATLTEERDRAATTALAGGGMWIGLAERTATDVLTWVTGEVVDLIQFGAPPTLTGDTFCTVLNGSGSWTVVQCAQTRRFLCEAD